MSLLHILERAVLVFVVVLAQTQTPAIAQIPAHQPGTVCATPRFWCWSAYPGTPGAQCACPSRDGWIQGVLV